jgi:hypothetical protein
VWGIVAPLGKGGEVIWAVIGCRGLLHLHGVTCIVYVYWVPNGMKESVMVFLTLSKRWGVLGPESWEITGCFHVLGG